MVGSLLAFRTPFPWHFRNDVWVLIGSLFAGAAVGIYVTYRSASKEVPRPSYGRAFSIVGVTLAVSAFALVFGRAYWSRAYLAWTVTIWLGMALIHRAIRRRRPWTEPLKRRGRG